MTGSLRRVGVIVLSMGRRPEGLQRALESVLLQEGVSCDIVVVGNGWVPTGLPEGVGAVALPTNVGIPAGRNAGIDAVEGDILLFLDDDAVLADSHVLERAVALLDADPRMGLIQPRVVDPTGLPSPRRWVPRLRVGDPERSSPAMALWEGATIVRRRALEAAGGWASDFFYAHEGIDLAWRVWDADYAAWYAGDLVVHHEANDPKRFPEHARLNARNRVWIARRNLPLPLEPIYVGSWILITLARERDRQQLRAWFEGLLEGIRDRPTGRRPMSWRTIGRMSRAGRPPVV
ncbi:MAG: glycosyltransferase family 2 protein [Candidatus Nanopelagicales bacterium]